MAIATVYDAIRNLYDAFRRLGLLNGLTIEIENKDSRIILDHILRDPANKDIISRANGKIAREKHVDGVLYNYINVSGVEIRWKAEYFIPAGDVLKRFMDL